MANDKDKTNGNVTTVEQPEALAKVEPKAPTPQPEVKVDTAELGLGNGATEATVQEILAIIGESTEAVTSIIESEKVNAIAMINAAQMQAQEEIEFHFLGTMEELETKANECVQAGHATLRDKLKTAKLTLASLKSRAGMSATANTTNGNGKH